MTLIKSISGIRGTIGGSVGDNLSPLDLVKFASAYAQWLKESNSGKLSVVVGRDARISGEMVSSLVINSLIAYGINVTDLGLSTTPGVEMEVTHLKANGGIILTASHNPKEWNALKLLNHKGEFLSGEEGELILNYAETEKFEFTNVDDLGILTLAPDDGEYHINEILALPLVNKEAIKKANFSVVIDAVNSTGGIFIPKLLEALGVRTIHELYCEPTGEFPHNPEPLPENLTEIAAKIKDVKADLGVVVDPDVDRLALVCENGDMFGEEYTLVAVADYILGKSKGNVVSNLSSSRALRDVAYKHGVKHFASAVGEVNVVKKMKAENAIIGGEGNGGVILPALHYGRDALAGIALFLSLLAEKVISMTELRKTYPSYFISKNKIQLHAGIDVDDLLIKFAEYNRNEEVSSIDGVKVDYKEGWVHLRKSNTEPIIRIYAEAKNEEEASTLANKTISLVESWI
jgi:phosphomannomutase